MFQQIHLSICKAIHGELSSEYFFLYQRYKKKYPNLQAGPKKCFSTDPILRFENLIIRNHVFPVFKTTKSILFEKTEFGSGIRDIIRVKGEADCGNFLQLGEDLIRVTGYRERIIDFSVLLLFYSSGERFFMGEYLFSTKEKSAWRQIASSICKKYDLTDCEEFRHFYIEDGKGSFLCLYDDGFSINIKFFNPVHCQPFDKLHAIFQPSKANLQSPSMELSSKILADRL